MPPIHRRYCSSERVWGVSQGKTATQPQSEHTSLSIAARLPGSHPGRRFNAECLDDFILQPGKQALIISKLNFAPTPLD